MGNASINVPFLGCIKLLKRSLLLQTSYICRCMEGFGADSIYIYIYVCVRFCLNICRNRITCRYRQDTCFIYVFVKCRDNWYRSSLPAHQHSAEEI